MVKVLYNDGDVEVLHLEKERWELVDGDHRPKKVYFVVWLRISLPTQGLLSSSIHCPLALSINSFSPFFSLAEDKYCKESSCQDKHYKESC